MTTLFTKIIEGEIPSYKVYEDDYAVGFLNIRPFRKGHVLVVPRVEIDNWMDMDEETHEHLWRAAKIIATTMKERIECQRIGVLIAGFEVPHVHIHLVPAETEADLAFTNAYEATKDELEEVKGLLVLS